MSMVVIAWVSFSSLAMLSWAGAALIPVIIHLLKRRKRTPVPWAAMQLLRQIVERESRRVNFQQLLLLLLRVLILLLLALALARPFLNRAVGIGDLSVTRPSKLWIFVLDTSYSMGYRSEELTRMERARQRAARMVRDAQAGDAFALIALDQPARSIIGNPTFNDEAILSEIQKLTENARGCDPVSALAIAGQIAASAQNQSELPKDVEVVVLSDLGLDAWQTASIGPVESGLKRLRQVATVTIEPIVDPKPINVVVEAVRLSQKRPIVGKILSADVSIASYGQSLTAIPVQLELDGQIVSTEIVDIEAGGRASIQMTVTPRQPGTAVLSIVTPSDNLPIDNRYDLVLDVRPDYRILIVDSRPELPNAWRIALQPETADKSLGVSGEVRVVSEFQWQGMSEKNWDVIVWNDIPLGAASSLDRLTRFVEGGGSLIIALGRNFATRQVASGDELPRADSAREKLLGFKIVRPSDLGDWAVDPLDYASPIIKVFDGFPNSGLLTTPVFRYWQIEAPESESSSQSGSSNLLPRPSGLTVDLATTTGQPLLVRHRLGKGAVASFLSAPEDGRGGTGIESWNAITAWPSFLPLAQQTVQALVDMETEQRNLLAGQPLTGSLPWLPLNQAVTLVRPDQSVLQITGQQSEAAQQTFWIYEATDQRGIYRVTEPEGARGPFAVNIDPVQSSLQSIDPRAVGHGDNVTSVSQMREQIYPPTANNRWSRYLLLSIGLLLVTESILARMLGRRIG